MTTGQPPRPERQTSRNPAVLLLSGLVHLYRLVLSPLLGPSCRFQPTCSEYALDALSKHGAARGAWLMLRRMLRCHPWGGSGWDPVPEPGHTQERRGHSHAEGPHMNGGGCCGH